MLENYLKMSFSHNIFNGIFDGNFPASLYGTFCELNVQDSSRAFPKFRRAINTFPRPITPSPDLSTIPLLSINCVHLAQLQSLLYSQFNKVMFSCLFLLFEGSSRKEIWIFIWNSWNLFPTDDLFFLEFVSLNSFRNLSRFCKLCIRQVQGGIIYR